MAASRKILIILALVVLVCVLYFFLIYQGKQNDIGKTQKQLAEFQQQLKEVQAASEGLDTIKLEINKLDEQLKESLAQLPEEKMVDSLLQSLEDLASSSGLEITKIQPSAEVPRDFYSEIPIEMQVTGGYHNIAIFFDKISKMKRVINISNLHLSNPADVNGEVHITADCVATTFRFRRVAEAPAKE